jgi:hypothetical protein
MEYLDVTIWGFICGILKVIFIFMVVIIITVIKIIWDSINKTK